MAQENGGLNARGVWRGIAADVQVQVRVPVFVAIVACIAATPITHLGMPHLGSGASASMAFLHLTLAPVAVAALLFGLVPGIVVGLFAGVADAPIGGLGILVAKKSIDSMECRREDGSNILTFRKGW